MKIKNIKAMLKQQNENLGNHFYDVRLDYEIATIRVLYPIKFKVAMKWAISNPELKNII